MKKKLFFSICFLFINIFIVLSQERKIILEGQLLNKATSYALEFVSVKLKNSKNEILEEKISNKEGFFSFSLDIRNYYFIEISFPGFKTYHKKITLNKDPINLGKIYLEEETSSLKEVVIKIPEKTSILTKMDKKIVHVGQDLLSSSTNAAQLLERLPSIRVDPQNGELSMQGGSVQVLIDGNPTNIPINQLIKQLPANSIDKIEIIPNPSAKYEANGSGILNIILKKGSRKKGYQISLDTGGQFGRTLSSNNKLNANINLGKFNLFATYSYNPGRRNTLMGQDLINLNQLTKQSLNSRLNFKFINYGFDYFIDKKNELSFYSTWFFNDSKDEMFDILPTKKLHLNQKIKDKSTQFEYNLNYKHKFDKKEHEFTLYGSFSHSKMKDEFDLIFSKNQDSSQKNTQQVLIKTHYKLPLSNSAELEIGGQYRKNNLKNFYQNLTTYQKIDFLFSRDIYASYFNYSKEINKFGIKVGLRGEYTLDQIGNKENFYNFPIKNKHYDLFPNLFFNYNLSKEHQFSLNYNKRIRRPTSNSITPIRRFQSNNFRFEGNPELKPAYPHQVSLSYLFSQKGNNLNISTFYRFTQNPIVFISEMDPKNPAMLIGKMGNYAKSIRYGIEFSANYKIFNCWNLNSSFELYQNNQSGFKNLAPKSFIQTTLRANNQFKLTRKLNLQLSGTYKAPEKNLQGSMESRSSIDLGLSTTILKDKGTISLGIYDIFKQNTFRGYVEIEGQKRKFYNDWGTRFVALNFSYSLGGKIERREMENSANQTQENSFRMGM